MTTVDDIPFGELRSFINSIPTYYEARCNHCWYSEPCLLEKEAELRGQIHEEFHDEDESPHRVDIWQMAFGGEVPDELGDGDGGYQEQLDEQSGDSE